MAWKTLDDMELSGKRVLTRVDLNVPMDDGRVTDATRIDRIVPTLKDIVAAGGTPVLLAHFGRPKGAVVPEMSLRPVVAALEAASGLPVTFAADCRGPAAQLNSLRKFSACFVSLEFSCRLVSLVTP